MARIGLLVPSSNTTVEPEFYRALPKDVTLHVARLFLTQITPEAILAMVQDLETQSRNLASADVDVIVLGATAPSFLKGLTWQGRALSSRAVISHPIGAPVASRACRCGRTPLIASAMDEFTGQPAE